MIYDENWNEVVEPDLTLGHIEEQEIEYALVWSVDKPAIFERQVIAEYPNGGKDVATVEVSPEVGHWQATLSDGGPLPFNPEVPATASKSQVTSVSSMVEVYTLYTEEELEARKLEAKQEQEETKRLAKREALLLGLEEWQNEHERQLKDVAQAQDETANKNTERDVQVANVMIALGELGELSAEVPNQTELVEALMMAVAELGEIVATLTAEPESEPEAKPEPEVEPKMEEEL